MEVEHDGEVGEMVTVTDSPLLGDLHGADLTPSRGPAEVSVGPPDTVTVSGELNTPY